MKEHPIIFTGEMVRAILDGRKTQTRRVIKPQPTREYLWHDCADGVQFWTNNRQQGEKGNPDIRKVPYGVSGDRLWVRETHVFEWWEDEPKPPTDRPLYHHEGDGTEWDEPYWLWPHYRATDPAPDLVYENDPNDDGEPKCKWRPSIFMPRWASRITLEILNVRVERLHDITTEDIRAEGIKQTKEDGYWLAPLAGTPDFPWGDARMAYASLWNSINAKSGFGWDVNPWVWVIEFKRVEQ